MKPLFLLALTLPLTLAATVHADVAPPSGYVETCSVDQREQPGTTCKPCPADFSTPNACSTMFSATKYTYVCQTWGGSAWTEVWCDGPPATPSAGGCAVAGPAASWSVVATVGLLAAAAALARRRRSRR